MQTRLEQVNEAIRVMKLRMEKKIEKLKSPEVLHMPGDFARLLEDFEALCRYRDAIKTDNLERRQKSIERSAEENTGKEL